MGKGSNPRPFAVDREQFRSNFDAIFRKEKNSCAEPVDEHPSKEVPCDQNVPQDPPVCPLP